MIKNVVALITFPLSILFLFAVLLALDSLSFKWLGVVLGACAFALVGLIIRDIKLALLFLLVFAIPLNLDFLLYSRDEQGLINGVFLSLVDISIFGLTILRAFKSLAIRNSQNLEIYFYPKITYPAVFFLLLSLLSLAVTEDRTWSIYGIIFHFKLFVTYFVIANSLKGEKEIRYTILVLLFTFLFQSIVYIFLSYSHMDFDILGNEMTSAISNGLFRPRGFMGQANTAGTFFASCLTLAISMYAIQRKAFHKVLIASIFVTGIWSLVLTYSRGAWASFLIATSLLLMVSSQQKWFRFRYFFLFVIMSVIIISIAWNSIRLRFNYDLAARSRVTTLELTWKIIKDHPILGIGVNSYLQGFRDYRTDDLRRRGAIYVVHNQYFLVWAEMGLIGLLSFLWFLLSIFREGIKIMRQGKNSNRIVILGIMSSLFAICLSMTTQPADNGTVPILTWFLAGLVAAFSTPRKTTLEELSTME